MSKAELEQVIMDVLCGVCFNRCCDDKHDRDALCRELTKAIQDKLDHEDRNYQS